MVRRYRDTPLEPGALHSIAAAILRGPTAGHSQGISVVTVTREDTRLAIARLAGEPSYRERGFEPWLSTAPAHLVICVEPDRYRGRYGAPDKDPAALEIPWWWVDGGAAMVLGALGAVDEGLAAGFLGGHRLHGIHELLGIPAAVEVLGILTVGHPAPDRRSGSLDRDERSDAVHHERWSDS
jgi:nitroreductase